jgi:hypothetical protein
MNRVWLRGRSVGTAAVAAAAGAGAWVGAGAVVGAGIAVGATGAGVLGAAAGAHAPSSRLTPIKIDKTAIMRFIFNLLYLFWVISHRKSRKPVEDGKASIFWGVRCLVQCRTSSFFVTKGRNGFVSIL